MDEIGALQIMTIRSNGKMFGYLMTVLSPSFESESIRSAVHTTFFVSNDLPGFGIKLQRVALQELLNRGITDVLMQAGVRGSGQRISSLYKRLGAVSDGELYRIRLEN
jgi:hypothetical protein